MNIGFVSFCFALQDCLASITYGAFLGRRKQVMVMFDLGLSDHFEQLYHDMHTQTQIDLVRHSEQ